MFKRNHSFQNKTFRFFPTCDLVFARLFFFETGSTARGSDRLKVVEDLGAFTSRVKPRLPPKPPRSSCALVFRGERLSWADSTGACWNKGALGPVFLSKRVAFFFWKGSQWKKTPMKFVEHFGTLRGFGVVFQKHPCFQGWCCFFKFQGMYIYSMFSFFIYIYIFTYR